MYKIDEECVREAGRMNGSVMIEEKEEGEKDGRKKRQRRKERVREDEEATKLRARGGYCA